MGFDPTISNRDSCRGLLLTGPWGAWSTPARRGAGVRTTSSRSDSPKLCPAAPHEGVAKREVRAESSTDPPKVEQKRVFGGQHSGSTLHKLQYHWRWPPTPPGMIRGVGFFKHVGQKSHKSTDSFVKTRLLAVGRGEFFQPPVVNIVSGPATAGTPPTTMPL